MISEDFSSYGYTALGCCFTMQFICSTFRCWSTLRQTYIHEHPSIPSESSPRYIVLQWNLSWKVTAIIDHLSWKTTGPSQKVPHFNATEPVTKDHLPWETIFIWPMGVYSSRQVSLYQRECRPLYYFGTTLEPVLKAPYWPPKNVVCQDRWSLVTGTVILKCRSFCRKCMVCQGRF